MKTITYDETQWKLVPVEPDKEMIRAGRFLEGADQMIYAESEIRNIWSDMLLAAPDAPEAPQAAASPQQEQDRKDAERYRWLSKQFRAMSLDMGGNHCWVQARSGSLRGPSVDAAVDAAMSAEGGTLEKP